MNRILDKGCFQLDDYFFSSVADRRDSCRMTRAYPCSIRWCTQAIQIHHTHPTCIQMTPSTSSVLQLDMYMYQTTFASFRLLYAFTSSPNRPPALPQAPRWGLLELHVFANSKLPIPPVAQTFNKAPRSNFRRIFGLNGNHSGMHCYAVWQRLDYFLRCALGETDSGLCPITACLFSKFLINHADRSTSILFFSGNGVCNPVNNNELCGTFWNNSGSQDAPLCYNWARVAVCRTYARGCVVCANLVKRPKRPPTTPCFREGPRAGVRSHRCRSPDIRMLGSFLAHTSVAVLAKIA